MGTVSSNNASQDQPVGIADLDLRIAKIFDAEVAAPRAVLRKHLKSEQPVWGLRLRMAECNPYEHWKKINIYKQPVTNDNPASLAIGRRQTNVFTTLVSGLGLGLLLFAVQTKQYFEVVQNSPTMADYLTYSHSADVKSITCPCSNPLVRTGDIFQIEPNYDPVNEVIHATTTNQYIGSRVQYLSQMINLVTEINARHINALRDTDIYTDTLQPEVVLGATLNVSFKKMKRGIKDAVMTPIELMTMWGSMNKVASIHHTSNLRTFLAETHAYLSNQTLFAKLPAASLTNPLLHDASLFSSTCSCYEDVDCTYVVPSDFLSKHYPGEFLAGATLEVSCSVFQTNYQLNLQTIEKFQTSHFATAKEAVESTAGPLIVDWNVSFDYDRYYDSCKPAQCTFVIYNSLFGSGQYFQALTSLASSFAGVESFSHIMALLAGVWYARQMSEGKKVHIGGVDIKTEHNEQDKLEATVAELAEQNRMILQLLADAGKPLRLHPVKDNDTVLPLNPQ
jgi:hypothetical protein